jgi:CheY-like chemotaxis protein
LVKNEQTYVEIEQTGAGAGAILEGLQEQSPMDRRRPRNPPIRPLVLIVESHEDTRMLYELALAARGFDVVAARNGDDPYRRAWETHPDVIVTDLPMPTYDGWQFLRDLRLDPRTRDIPVIAVTGYLQPSVRERADRDGFAALFPKPCLPDELASGIRQVLDGSIHAQVQR